MFTSFFSFGVYVSPVANEHVNIVGCIVTKYQRSAFKLAFQKHI